jgi:putative exporter of polyketide antibiotics
MQVTSIPKCLDKKLSIFGFEIIDLCAIFVSLSILNLLFGEISRVFLVWIPTVVLALVLHFGKKGKPEKYLIHFLKFQFIPGTYSAFEDSKDFVPPPYVGGLNVCFK